MKVYVTAADYFDNVRIIAEADSAENLTPTPIPDDIAEWITQYAESGEQAIAQHFERHNEWSDDIMHNRIEKKVY